MQQEDWYCEIVGEVREKIQRSGLGQFNFPCIDAFYQDVNAVLYELERLPDQAFRERIEVVLGLREARNELRLARFLFEAEEIDPVRRFVLRSKAVLRGERILDQVLRVWRSLTDYNSSHE